MEQKDDTHLCLRCSRTIVGLDNYVTHRQQHCLSIPTPQEPKEKDLSADVPQPCTVTPLSSSPPQSTSWDVPLTASDFFSCLELQSTVSAPRTDISSSIPNQQFECSPKALRSSVSEISSISGSVNAPTFDDVEECDQGFYSECETNSTEYYPPRSYTGGKWKPGSRPHLRNRQQWGLHNSQSSACDIEQNIKSYSAQNLQLHINDCIFDALNFEHGPTSKSSPSESMLTCKNVSVEFQGQALLKKQVEDFSNAFDTNSKHLRKSYRCNYCNKKFSSHLSYTFHLFSATHKEQFTDTKGYHEEIFRHENMLICTAQFQCQVCSFYFNDSENFLSHLRSNEHSKNTGISGKLICLPWKLQFETCEEISRKLFKILQNAIRVFHPVIILKDKVPLFCNFCARTCRYLQSSKKSHKSTVQKRVGYRNAIKHSSCNRGKYIKECAFCHGSFVLKDYKKHNKTCVGESMHNEVPISVAEKECFDVNFSVDSTCGISQTSTQPSACSDVEEITSNSVLSSGLCKQKQCLLPAKCSEEGNDGYSFNREGKEAYGCSSCQKKFIDKETLLKHVKLHSGKQIYRCFKCDFQAVKRSLLRRHEETHSSNRLRPFVCEICSSAHLYKWALMQHMRVHEEGTFKCDTNGCQHLFRSQTELVQHQRVHTNERPYHCDVCEYRGKTAHQLKKHQRTHTGERPFKCKHCPYSASLSHQLLRHMRVHTGSKPYKCPYCDYVCNNQENIRKHILKTKKHEGEKMYPCMFCSFACNDFPVFQKHLLCLHKEHFPKGHKDIDSSVVAGLYKKDFPRREPSNAAFVVAKKL